MIQCKACGKEFKMITNSHLKKGHSMTPEEYLLAYPGALLCDEEMKKKVVETRYRVEPDEYPRCHRPGCKNRVNQKHHKYCSRPCAMSHRMSRDGRGEQNAQKNHSYKEWYYVGKYNKKKARERDGFCCKRCGEYASGKALHVHHLIPERCFDEANVAHDLTNLVCLCNKCHQVVEWGMFRELYQRALQLEALMKGVPDFVPLVDFKESLLINEN